MTPTSTRRRYKPGGKPAGRSAVNAKAAFFVAAALPSGSEDAGTVWNWSRGEPNW